MCILVVCRVSGRGWCQSLHTELVDRSASLLVDTFQVVENTDPFSFLLSVGSEEDSLPPGMLGCVKSVTAHSTQGEKRKRLYFRPGTLIAIFHFANADGMPLQETLGNLIWLWQMLL